MDTASVLKPLKIYNFSTAIAILMKLIMIMQFHKVLLRETWGINHRVSEGVNEKPFKIWFNFDHFLQIQ